jgi:Tfp pilus assembly protein PilN
MINLLPDIAKSEIQAARSNVKLFNYLIIVCLGIVFLAFITVGVYFVMASTQASADAIVSDNRTKTAAYSSVQAQADALQASLVSANTILNSEVVYSKVVTGIAAAMPTGSVLQSLTLSATTFDAPITLTIYSKSTDDALKLKDNFQKSPLFSNVNFQALSTTAGTAANVYPVSATIGLTINKAAAK